MKRAVPGIVQKDSAACAAVRVLVESEHDMVRRELVIYLGRAPTLAVSGDVFSCDAIVKARPHVVVLDLSQLSLEDVQSAIRATRRVGASLIALASLHDAAAMSAVTEAGGRYHLKSALADGLADEVSNTGRGVAEQRSSRVRPPARRRSLECASVGVAPGTTFGPPCPPTGPVVGPPLY